jgi:hypothetical protein
MREEQKWVMQQMEKSPATQQKEMPLSQHLSGYCSKGIILLSNALFC